jgi:succinyl-diaminopimelate desuccinylase
LGKHIPESKISVKQENASPAADGPHHEIFIVINRWQLILLDMDGVCPLLIRNIRFSLILFGLHPRHAMKEIIDLTKELIQFRSLHSEPGEIIRCAGFVQSYLKRHGIDFLRFDHQDVPSILAPPPKGRVPVLLLSHIDVVDGSDDLFMPYEKNGSLYGRGSVDDKYAVALSLVLLKNYLVRLGEQKRGEVDPPFAVLITGDEEIGGKNGAKKVLQEIESDFCIVLDGGSLEEIVVKEKGILKLKLISRGKAAHGARPWMGDNAIEKLIADYLKLKTFFDHATSGDSDHWHRTMNFSIVHAGKSQNQVPDIAEAMFDVRYTETDRIDELIEQIRGEMQSELVVEAIEPLFISRGTPERDILLKIAKTASLGYEHGASDARHLAAFGIQGIVWGADGELSQHTAGEHVRIESVYALYDYLYEFMEAIEAKTAQI